jgi:hypothetical protein
VPPSCSVARWSGRDWALHVFVGFMALSITILGVESQAAAKKHAAGYWKAWWSKFQSMSYGQKNAVYRKVRRTTCTCEGTAHL